MVWAHDHLGRDYAIHLIDPANAASERVAQKLGAEVTGTWAIPGGGIANIWTTRWESFTQTETYANLPAAGT
jgi:RimJ/RimL family protein N-acetyltransferase